MAFCSNCGTQLSDGTKFCPKCGTPIENSDVKMDSSHCSVELISTGRAILQVAKALTKALGVDLKEANDFIDSAPCAVAEGLSLSKAQEIAQIIQRSGAKVVIKQGGVSIPIEVPQQNTDNVKQTEKEGTISIWAKIALSFAVFIAFMGVIGGIANDAWVVVIISICGLGAIYAVFTGSIEKKYAWTTAIVTFLVVCCAIGTLPSSEEKEQKQTQTEQKTETPAEKKVREQKEQADKQESEKQEKVNKVAKMAYQKGYDVRKETWGQSISPESSARLEYTFRYGKEPEDAGQNERWNVYLENFKKGFADAAHEIMKKRDSEDF